MSILFVGDVHASSTDIKTRSDKSSETVLEKLEWVCLLAVKSGYSSVVFTGDFISGNNLSTSYLLRLIALKKYNLKMYTITGNHECLGDDYSSIPKSQISLLFESGLLSPLEYLSTSMGSVVGYNAYETEEEFVKKISNVPKPITGLVVHHFLSELTPGQGSLYLSVKRLKDILPDLRYIVAGHDHTSYANTDVSGVLVLRPGSLLRTSSIITSNRDIRVCGFRDDTSLSVSDNFIDIVYNHALDYNSVFNKETDMIDKFAFDSISSLVAKFESSRAISVDPTTIFMSVLNSVKNEYSRDIIKADLKEHGFYDIK